MQISAIILARVIGYVESFDLNPRGKVFFPEIIPEIVRNFNFQKFPKSSEHPDESKGIEFAEGKMGDVVIQKFTIWSNIVVVETRSNTNDSKKILDEALLWAAEKFGINYRSGMIKRFAYVSDLSFYSDAPILYISPALATIANKTSEAVSEIWQEPVKYEPQRFDIGHDPTVRKYAIAPFSITRRAEARFSENKYFSEAPLPTDMHISILEEFEESIKRTEKR